MSQHRKWICFEAILVLSLLSLLLYVMFPKFLEAQNINTPENFPDPAFRAAVEHYMGVEPGGRFTRSEARKKSGILVCTQHSVLLDTVNFNFQPVHNVKGIEFLSGILKLELGSLAPSDFNLAFFPELTYLDCNNSPLQSIDTSKNPYLHTLKCKGCGLQKLDLSRNHELFDLDCSDNPLQTLDLSYNTELNFLKCSNTQISTLDITMLPRLMNLYCNNNSLEQLDTSQNPLLQIVQAKCNKLKEMDLRKNLYVKYLDLSFNQIKNMPDFRNHLNLHRISIEMNNLDCEDLPHIHAARSRLAAGTLLLSNPPQEQLDYKRQNDCDLSECEESNSQNR